MIEKKFRESSLAFLFILLGIIAASDFTRAALPKQEDLNVLLITIDTIRPDRLSCYSPRYLQTPHIDALAAKGVLFERAFAHNPMTLPSHVNILTGTTPLYHGVHENSKSILAQDFMTLAEYLKEKGYSTGAFIGSFALDSRFGLNQGFDVYDKSYPSRTSSLSPPERNAGQVIQAALGWLEKQNSKWFLFVHLWDPHEPYSPPPPFSERFRDDLYSGEVAYVDSELGKLFDYLESKGLTKKTVIVLTGDHGESLGEHGELTHDYFAYNSTLWIPLIIAAPGISPARVDEYVCHIDLFPTACDLLALEQPAFLQGVSLLPLLNGGKIKKRPIYFESLDAYYNRGWAPLRGFTEEKRKFIDSPLPEYYNLEDDFKEQNNLVQKTVLERQKKKLKDLMDSLSSLQKTQAAQRVDRETLEKLRSLGYVSSPVSKLKENYGPADDLKTLLPLNQKNSAAMKLNEEGKIAEAIKLFHDIIKERKDFTNAYVYLSEIYQSGGFGEDALAVLESGYENNPEDYGIISSYGVLLVKQGKLDQGIELLQKSIAIIDYYPEDWTYLGIAYGQKGEFQKALNCYEKALALDDTDAMVYYNKGLFHLSQFMQLKSRPDHARALECFKKAIELDPSLASAYNGLGVGYRIAGQIDAAIAVWEKTLELNPDFDLPVFNLGVAYLEKGDKAQALRYFEKYLLLKNNTLSPEERREVEEYIKNCRN
jgi:arylsulfatase A-like enzyme/tetratricopeptide (TPR) repeat protein